MKNYLELWMTNLLRRDSARLTERISVFGHREKHFGPKSEFGRIVLSVEPAEHFDVVDNVPCRTELEELGVRWPESVVFGLLDILMFAAPIPLYKVRVVLEDAAYRHIDSSENAFREAGRDAGSKIIDIATRNRLLRF